jgi:hypothetical protein
MQTDRWQQIELLFHSALECAPHERVMYLMQACASELVRIINKALSKDRAERYQTIKELELDLKAQKQKLETEDESKAAQRPSVKTGWREENADFASFTLPQKRRATAKRAMRRSIVILKFLVPAIALTGRPSRIRFRSGSHRQNRPDWQTSARSTAKLLMITWKAAITETR